VWGWHERQIREYAGSSIGFNVHRELGNGETRPETPNKCENWSSECCLSGLWSDSDGRRTGIGRPGAPGVRSRTGWTGSGCSGEGQGPEGPDVYLSQI
jgi:hypothetical protein